MSSRCILVAATVAMLHSVFVTHCQAQPTLVYIESLDELNDDAEYLARRIGLRDVLSVFQAVASAATGGRFTDAIDEDEPLGLYVADESDDLEDETAVVFLPLEDREEFLDLLETIGRPSRSDRDGLRVIDNIGGDIFLRFANGYVYCAMDRDALPRSISKPATLLPKDHDGTGFFVRWNSQQLSGDSNPVAELVGAVLDEPFGSRRDSRFHGLALFNLGPYARGIDLFEVRLRVDRKLDRITLKSSLTPNKDSRLAEDIGKFQTGTTPLQAYADGAAVFLHTSVPLRDHLRDAFEIFRSPSRKADQDDESDDDDDRYFSDLLDAVSTGIPKDRLDLGFVITNGTDNERRVLLGLGIDEGDRLADRLDSLYEDVSGSIPKSPDVKDGDTKTSWQPRRAFLWESPGARSGTRYFDGRDVHMFVSPDYLVIAIEESGNRSLRTTAKTLTAATEPLPPVRLEMQIDKLGQFLGGHAERRADRVFSGDTRNRDRIRAEVSRTDRTLHVDFSLDTAVIEFFTDVPWKSLSWSRADDDDADSDDASDGE